jgi:hypothetical protein
MVIVQNDSTNAGPDKLLSISICDYHLAYNVPKRSNGYVVPGSIQYVPDCHHGEQATFSLYALSDSGVKSQSPLQVIEHQISTDYEQDTISMVDWNCMPRGKYRLEMTKSDTRALLSATNFEKTIDMQLFYLTVGQYPVLSEANFYFRNEDENLVGKLARVAVTKGDTIFADTQTTIAMGSNQTGIKLGRYVTLPAGDYKANLYINGFLVDSSDLKKVDISHEIGINVDSFNFGEIAVGSSRSVMLTLFNRGNSPAMISAITSTNPDFTVNKTAPFSLAAGARTGIDVIYTPTSKGAKAATLSFTNAPDESVQTLTLPVSGTGI